MDPARCASKNPTLDREWPPQMGLRTVRALEVEKRLTINNSKDQGRRAGGAAALQLQDRQQRSVAVGRYS